VAADVLLTYLALSDPTLPVAEGDPVTASLIGALGLAGGLAADALVRILIFTLALRYIYVRALALPRIIPLYWGAAAALVVLNGAVVVNNIFAVCLTPRLAPPPTWRCGGGNTCASITHRGASPLYRTRHRTMHGNGRESLTAGGRAGDPAGA
jgi:hypothetical protein